MVLDSSRKDKKKTNVKIEPMNVASMVVPVYGGKKKSNNKKRVKSKKRI